MIPTHLAHLVVGGNFALQRVSTYCALQALEAAGLLTVQRQRGRAPVVTLVTPQGGQL